MARIGGDFSDELALWYKGRCGRALKSQIAAVLPDVLAQISGTAHLLIAIDDIDLGDKITFRAQFIDLYSADAKVQFLPESMDSVILWHSLDAVHEPQRIVHIAATLAAKSGYLVVIGFNPHSLFGLLRLPMRWLRRNPWQSGFYSQKRISDWLHVLNYQLRVQATVAVLPPRLAQFLAPVERFLHWLFPYWGTVQILVAKHPWFPMTGVVERRQPNPLAILTTPEPATRQIQPHSKDDTI